jgi:NAD dependent epimerase/dehydratase family enzyme
MGVNQNSSRGLGLYPKSVPQNRVRDRKTQPKTIIDTSKTKCETTVSKIELTSNSSSHRHFTKHLVDAVEEQLRESNMNDKTSSFSIR